MLPTLVDRVFDHAAYSGRILQYLVSGYPKHRVSHFIQIRVALLVMLATFFGLVVRAVNLDDQLQHDTAEVGRIQWNRVLAAKLLLAASSITNDLPNGISKLVGLLALV